MPIAKLTGKILKFRSEMKQIEKGAKAFAEGMKKGHDLFLESLAVPLPDELQSMVDSSIMPMVVERFDAYGKEEKKNKAIMCAFFEELRNFVDILPHAGRGFWIRFYYGLFIKDKPPKKLKKNHAILYGIAILDTFGDYERYKTPPLGGPKGTRNRWIEKKKVKEFVQFLDDEGFRKPVTEEQYKAVIDEVTAIRAELIQAASQQTT